MEISRVGEKQFLARNPIIIIILNESAINPKALYPMSKFIHFYMSYVTTDYLKICKHYGSIIPDAKSDKRALTWPCLKLLNPGL